MVSAATVSGSGSILLPYLLSQCVYFVSSLGLFMLQHSHNDKLLLNKILSINPAYQLVFMTGWWGVSLLILVSSFLVHKRGNTNMQMREY